MVLGEVSCLNPLELCSRSGRTALGQGGGNGQERGSRLTWCDPDCDGETPQVCPQWSAHLPLGGLLLLDPLASLLFRASTCLSIALCSLSPSLPVSLFLGHSLHFCISFSHPLLSITQLEAFQTLQHIFQYFTESSRWYCW